MTAKVQPLKKTKEKKVFTNTQILAAMITAAKLASKEILKVYNSNNFHTKYKKDQSPVTIADKLSAKTMDNALKQFNIPIINEEIKNSTYSIRKKWKEYFIVDPLDGTKNFILKDGGFSINIGYAKNKKAVLGVIFIPTQDTYYYSDGKDSYKVEKGKTTKLPKKHANHKPLRISVSKNHCSPETVDYIKSLKEKYFLLKSGSNIKICLVSEGKSDLYPRLAPTGEWDTAAGHAIAKTAGRNVYDFKTGKELTYNKKCLENPWFIVR